MGSDLAVSSCFMCNVNICLSCFNSTFHVCRRKTLEAAMRLRMCKSVKGTFGRRFESCGPRCRSRNLSDTLR